MRLPRGLCLSMSIVLAADNPYIQAGLPEALVLGLRLRVWVLGFRV